MKRRLCVLLALVQLLVLSTTVLADESGEIVATIPGSGQAAITAEFEEEEGEAPAYFSVTVTWETSGSIRYTVYADSYVWDPDTLEYKNTGASGVWSVNDAQIKIIVTNRSNVPVEVSCNPPVPYSNNGITAITGYYDNSTIIVGTCAPEDASQLKVTGAQAPTATATFTISRIEGTITGDGRIGNMTVGIQPAGTSE